MSDNDPDGQVTDAGPRPNLPSADAVKRAIGDAPVKQRKAQKKFEKNFKVEESDAERQYAHSRGLQDHYRHKTYWSYFLMVLMFSIIGFQSLLLLMVGAGIWDFTKYQWLLPVLLVQNLAQVVGLAVFVVKSLFKDLQ